MMDSDSRPKGQEHAISTRDIPIPNRPSSHNSSQHRHDQCVFLATYFQASEVCRFKVDEPQRIIGLDPNVTRGYIAMGHATSMQGPVEIEHHGPKMPRETVSQSSG